MKIQPKIGIFPIDYANGKALNGAGFARAERKRLTSRTRNFSLVPIIVEGDLDAIGYQSALQLAYDAGVTHILVASPPLYASKKVKFDLGVAPISELASLASPGRRSQPNRPKAALSGFALVFLDARTPFPIDEDTMWDLWLRRDAWWRCRQNLTWFEASRPLWQIFGHKLYDDDDGDLPDFLDIDITTVGGPNQGHWGPLHGYRGPFPFTACFQIERAIGSQTRWILSIIDKVEDWYVGLVEDITPQLAELKRQISFELEEAQAARLAGNRPGFQAGVFLQILGSRDEGRTELGAAQ